MPDCLDGPRLARLFADGSWTQLWTEPEWSQKHAGVGALVLFRGCFGPGSARTWGGQSPARALDLGQRGSAGRNRVISCPKILSLSSLENVRVATRCCIRWRILPPGLWMPGRVSHLLMFCAKTVQAAIDFRAARPQYWPLIGPDRF